VKKILHFLRPSPTARLGPLEQRLLEALWSRGSATVRELMNAADDAEASGDHKIAYTTVMTTLDRLYKKRLLSRVAEGRAFRYSPRHTREEIQKAAAGEAIRQLLDASAAASLPLSFLVEVLTERDSQLLDDLQALVERKRSELRRQRKDKP
jgi:predicted transcriptional regulator